MSQCAPLSNWSTLCISSTGYHEQLCAKAGHRAYLLAGQGKQSGDKVAQNLPGYQTCRELKCPSGSWNVNWLVELDKHVRPEIAGQVHKLMELLIQVRIAICVAVH
jgi:hypothetical protein